MDTCALCGKVLAILDHGAPAQCCGGVAYWSKNKPLPADLWWPVTTSRGYTLYTSSTYDPRKHKIVDPKQKDNEL